MKINLGTNLTNLFNGEPLWGSKVGDPFTVKFGLLESLNHPLPQGAGLLAMTDRIRFITKIMDAGEGEVNLTDKQVEELRGLVVEHFLLPIYAAPLLAVLEEADELPEPAITPKKKR